MWILIQWQITNFLHYKTEIITSYITRLVNYFIEMFCLVLAADTNSNQQARTNATVFTTQADNASQISGKTSFAVPAPPPLASAEKVRRLSDGEHFRQPNVTVSGHTTVQKQLQEAQTQAQAQALADMILKVVSLKIN